MNRTHVKKPLTPEGSGPFHEIVLHPDHMDDSTLWKAFRSGDEKALITIFDRLMQPLFNYGYKIAGERELVKDSIQELFIDLWQNRSRLGDTDSIKYYLFKSLRRKLLRMRTSAKALFFESFPDDYDAEVSPSQEFVMIADQLSLEKKSRAMDLLKTLTRRQQEAMFLRYFDELTCDQIAMVMEVSKQSVYNLIHDAIAELRKNGLASGV